MWAAHAGRGAHPRDEELANKDDPGMRAHLNFLYQCKLKTSFLEKMMEKLQEEKPSATPAEL